MAGDQLSQLLLQQQHQQKGISKEGENYKNTPDLPRACVHRVRNNLKRARLSISYEIRL